MPGLNAQILEEAAEWLIEFSVGDDDTATRQKFDAWLRISPEHIRAYLEVLPIWEDGALLPADSTSSPEALIALARSMDNVVPMTRKVQKLLAPSYSGQRRRRIAIAVAVVLLSIALGIVGWVQSVRHPTYSTQVAEQRFIELSDGSMVELNARSRVHIRFSEHERAVDLLQGQALFRVAKNSPRPFVVVSDGTRIRAVGTAFDVNRVGTGTTVTVLEGRVSVARDRSMVGIPGATALQASAPILLSPGEQVTVAPRIIPRPMPVNVAAATAWTQRHFAFDASTLAEVVEEFNRYNARQLVIRDPELGSLPITADFSSADPASLIRFLQAQRGISVNETEHEAQISIRR